jgi:hypothetical protein
MTTGAVSGRLVHCFVPWCGGLVIAAASRWRIGRRARLGQRLAVAIRIVFGLRTVRRGTRLAAATATEWASAFCHELENMMRDNIERGGRGARPNGATVVRRLRRCASTRRCVPTAHRNASKSKAESNDRTRLEPESAAWGGVVTRRRVTRSRSANRPQTLSRARLLPSESALRARGRQESSPADGYEYYMA